MLEAKAAELGELHVLSICLCMCVALAVQFYLMHQRLLVAIGQEVHPSLAFDCDWKGSSSFSGFFSSYFFVGGQICSAKLCVFLRHVKLFHRSGVGQANDRERDDTA